VGACNRGQAPIPTFPQRGKEWLCFVERFAMSTAPQHRSWPRWLRRSRMEVAACIVIALGIFMMLQPFALILYTWSFLTTLAGTLMFTIVSKFPD
jgi:hypothetical protein